MSAVNSYLNPSSDKFRDKLALRSSDDMASPSVQADVLIPEKAEAEAKGAFIESRLKQNRAYT